MLGEELNHAEWKRRVLTASAVVPEKRSKLAWCPHQDKVGQGASPEWGLGAASAEMPSRMSILG